MVKIAEVKSKIHWVQGTFHWYAHHELVMLREMLCAVFVDHFGESRGKSLRGKLWDTTITSARGLSLAWRAPDDGAGYGTAWLSIPGSALDQLHAYKLQQLVERLNDLPGWRCSRLDLAADDYQRSVMPAQVWRAIQERDVVGVTQGTYMESTSRGLGIGQTCYVGARSSSKRMRVYDKYVESGGKVNAIRWECQFANRQAVAAWDYLLENIELDPAVWLSECATLVFGAYRFIDRNEKKKRVTAQLVPGIKHSLNELQVRSSYHRLSLLLP